MIEQKEKKQIATAIACGLSFLYIVYLFKFLEVVNSSKVTRAEMKADNFLEAIAQGYLEVPIKLIDGFTRFLYSTLIFIEIIVVCMIFAFIITSLATKAVWSYDIVIYLSSVLLFNIALWDTYPIFVIVSIAFAILMNAFIFYDYRRIKKKTNKRVFPTRA